MASKAIAAAPKAISDESAKTDADRQVETQRAVLTTRTNPTMHGDPPSVANSETKTTQPQLITACASPQQLVPSPSEPRKTDFPTFDIREIEQMSEADRRREAEAMELPELGNFIRPALVGNKSLIETYRAHVQSFMERTARQGRQKLLTNEKGEPADRDDVVREYLGVSVRRVNQLLAASDSKPKPKASLAQTQDAVVKSLVNQGVKHKNALLMVRPADGQGFDSLFHSTIERLRPSAQIVRASAFAIPLRDESVQTVVTSPPYFGLRRYPAGTDKDLGREKTIGLYVEHLVSAMREVWRVLRNDGTVFLNIADSYHRSGRGKGATDNTRMNPLFSGTPLIGQGKAKSLCLVPHKVMINLENDGWIIRNDIIWEKTNAVPESVRDRCTSSYEHVIVLVKSQKYYYWNREEAREASVCWEKGSLGGGVTATRKPGKMKAWTMRHSNKVGSSKTAKRFSTGEVLRENAVKWPVGVGPEGDALISDGNVKHQALGEPTPAGHRVEMKPTRNLRDVWHIATKPHKEAHIAMFPEELVERCIRIGSKDGDIVLDPFAGAGTTGLVAGKLGRKALLLDISAEYCRLMRNRLRPPRSEGFESRGAAESKAEGDKTEEGRAEEASTDPVLEPDPLLSPRRSQTVVINREFVEWARAYAGPTFHACLCDPGYGYRFMGAKWDDPRQMTRNQVHSYLPPGQRMTTLQENMAFQQACKEWGEALLPHLFPGALVMMFAGPRMWEWVATGMEMAGFEHWDTMMWLYGSGFPKAMDIGRQIAKLTGERPIAEIPNPAFAFMKNSGQTSTGWKGVIPETKQIYANPWQGRKTPALKPAWEPILCFRAPRQGMTNAELALKFGAGTLNVDGGRIGTGAKKWDTPKGGIWHASEPGEQRWVDNPLGRYPANLILDEESAQILDSESGANVSRFFYCAKASRREREAGCEDLPVTNSGMSNGARTHGEGYDRGQDIGLNRVIPRHNDHPCVKPLDLCRYLATLLLPPESVAPRRLVVPFLGSGSEMIGAEQAGWDEIVGIEQNAHYCEIAQARLRYWRTASIGTTVLPPSSLGRTDAGGVAS